jgi:hypothetical protein
MVTREQAAAECEAKKETHERFVKWVGQDFHELTIAAGFISFGDDAYFEYELRPKQPAWTGSRDDVIALLKELELL